MTSFVALLRGVNVAGRGVLKMSDLIDVSVELGLRSPRTYIASGNLLFVSERSEDDLRTMLEKSIRARLGKDMTVALRTSEEMEAVLRTNPFGHIAPKMVQIFFLNTAPSDDLVGSARNIADEQIALGTREVFVAYGEKGIGRSRLRIPQAEEGTARNLNTVTKLTELAKELA